MVLLAAAKAVGRQVLDQVAIATQDETAEIDAVLGPGLVGTIAAVATSVAGLGQEVTVRVVTTFLATPTTGATPTTTGTVVTPPKEDYLFFQQSRLLLF